MCGIAQNRAITHKIEVFGMIAVFLQRKAEAM